MAIIFGFQLLVPQPERTPTTEEQTNGESLVDLSIKKPSTNSLVDRSEKINETGRVVFDNSKIKGSINLKGGIIDDLILEEFTETLDPTSDLIEFLNPEGSDNAYHVYTGWLSSDSTIKLPNSDSIWIADKSSMDVNNPVKLTWTSSQNITFEKIISLDENYLFNVIKGL